MLLSLTDEIFKGTLPSLQPQRAARRRICRTRSALRLPRVPPASSHRTAPAGPPTRSHLISVPVVNPEESVGKNVISRVEAVFIA